MIRATRAAAALLLLSACASGHAPSRAVRAKTRSFAPFHYEVDVAEGARELRVAMVLPAGSGDALGVEDDADAFVRDLEIATAEAYRPLAPEEPFAGADEGHRRIWRLPPCPATGCRVRYRFALEEAARSLHHPSVAALHHGATLSPPSTWLLHPIDPPDGQPFTLRVKTPPGTRFTSGLLPAPTGVEGEYAADVSDLPKAPYSAFGDLRIHTRDVDGERIDVAILPGPMALSDEALVSAVTRAAGLVRAHYRRPTIARALVLLVPAAGSGIGYARVLGNGGAAVMAPVGTESSAADVGGWELVHEMLHIAFPNLLNEHAWLEEGMATYVEPLIRARAGLVTPEHVFGNFVRSMPYGLPREGDRGLDFTRTWGRLYWGGALFCLLADVEIRERTKGARSLDDALRAVLAEGGNVTVRWDVERVIEVGDAATGVPVLAELYKRMALGPAGADLEGLWARLGVRKEGEHVTFDDSAELAWLRRAMVTP